MRQEYLLTCCDLEELGMWNTRHCCDFCHEDVEYGYDLLERTLPDGRGIIVCCACEPWNPQGTEFLTLDNKE